MIPVQFRNAPGRVAMVDGTVRWRHPLAGEHGGLDFRVPRADPAFDPRLMPQDEPFGVSLNTPLGTWAGVCELGETTMAGASVNGRHLSALAGARRVSLTSTHRGMTGAVLARLAAADALDGTELRLGRFTESPPAIDAYTFSADTLEGVLRDLADRTGGLWRVSSGGVLDWTSDPGRNLTEHLVAGGWLTDVRITVDQSSGSTMQARVRRASLNVSAPVVTVQYGWGRKWGRRWGGRDDAAAPVAAIPALDLREGDYVLVHVPWRAGVPGGVTCCRVLGRDWDGSEWVDVLLAEHALARKAPALDRFGEELSAVERRLRDLEHGPRRRSELPEPAPAAWQRPVRVLAAATTPAPTAPTTQGTTPAGGAGTTTTPTGWPEYREPTDIGGRE